MSTGKLPCFYHPTTVVIVDDNPTFLDNLPASLDQHSIYRLFDSTVAALDFLETQYQHLPSPEDFLGVTDNLLVTASLYVNIPKIHQKIYDQKRFSTPSVIIIDHAMPGMTGIEFCQRLSAYPIKKIMLTGVADHKLAIQAFNDGIIHKFILKNDPEVFTAINDAVHSLQQEYFLQLSELMIKNISTTTTSFLTNKIFQDFFSDFRQKLDIREFYLTSAAGSFLLLDGEKDLTWLVVQTAEEIENYQQAAEDHEAAKEVIQALACREKLLCLFSEDDYRQSVSKWPDYLYPAHPISGLVQGFYSVPPQKQTKKITQIMTDKILSYSACIAGNMARTI